jgi:Spy/CpxP family protein refolding chaperone
MVTKINTMHKIFIAVSALLLTTGGLQAQTNGSTKEATSSQTTRKQGRKALAQLHLTDAQKKQAKEIRESYRKQDQELRSNTQLSKTELDKQLKALHQDQKEKMQGILTADQKAQLAKSGRHKGQDKHHPANIDQMKSRLGLTDEQTTQIKANRTDFQTKMKAIRADQNLTAEQKKEQLQTLSKEQRTKMQSILTPEQKAKMKMPGKKNDGNTRK